MQHNLSKTMTNYPVSLYGANVFLGNPFYVHTYIYVHIGSHKMHFLEGESRD